MSSAKIKNSFTKWGIHPHDNEAPDYSKLSLGAEHSIDSTFFEGRKLNVATQTPSTQSFETNRLRENSVLVALGAQRQIISKGCDDSVLCSYRFEALLFSKREKWIEFVLEAELMPYGSTTEAYINFTKDSDSTISPMIKIEKDFIGESVHWNLEGDLSSFSIKTQDNLPIEIDQEDQIGLGLGEEELLNPPIKMEVEDLRDQEKEIIYRELLDPLAELDVDAELLGSSLHDNSIKGAKPELDPPPDLGWNDPLLVKEEGEDEKYSYPPSSSEASLERELATDSTTKDELSRISKEKFHPLPKDCYVKVERIPRELAPRCEATNKALNNAEKIKEQIKFFSESTRKGADDTSPSSKRIRMTPELTDNINLEPESQSVYAICEDNINSVHKLKSTYCTKCHMTFSTETSLNRHIFSVHKKTELFKCNSCSYVCGENKTLSKHLKIVHKIIKHYKCTDCDFAARCKYNLTIHMKSVHWKIKPYKCLECKHTCSLKGNLVSHMKSVHGKTKPFKCLECNFSCSQKSSLKRHVKFVHEKIKPFKCLKCNYSCSQKCDLLNHMKSVHEKLKPFKCLKCSLSCSKKCDLLKHIKSVHEKLKPFKCLKCNYSFSRKSNLAHHMMSVHNKIKPFKCLECNYSCSLKHSLTIHTKSVHLKIRPFKCMECNRSFSQKINLAVHMTSVHNKIKPFKCLECNYSCSLKHTLTNHTKSVHLKKKNI